MSHVCEVLAWILRGALAIACVAQASADDTPTARLAAGARAIFRQHCVECHGSDPDKAKGDGLQILDHAALLKRELIAKGKPDASELLRRIETDNLDELMPPEPKSPLSAAERRVIREWISAGAPSFPGGSPPVRLCDSIRRFSGVGGQRGLSHALPRMPRRIEDECRREDS